VIGEEQFANIRSVSDVVNTIIAFLTEKQKQYPSLFKIIENLYITTEIIDAINHIIDIHGEVKSSASKELGEIRRDLSAKRRESDRRFRSFVNDLKKLVGYAIMKKIFIMDAEFYLFLLSTKGM
jgi:dsDNA-specific endonuclease/ATPase MutS2